MSWKTLPKIIHYPMTQGLLLASTWHLGRNERESCPSFGKGMFSRDSKAHLLPFYKLKRFSSLGTDPKPSNQQHLGNALPTWSFFCQRGGRGRQEGRHSLTSKVQAAEQAAIHSSHALTKKLGPALSTKIPYLDVGLTQVQVRVNLGFTKQHLGCRLRLL